MLRLRPFRPSDDPQLLSWFGTSEELRRFAGDNVAWPLTVDQLDRWRADAQVTAWSAWCVPEKDIVVGHVQLLCGEPGTGLLARVGVAPRLRGQGHGRALVTAALDRAARRGLRWVRLNVYRDNEPAMRLYASLGFVDLGSAPGRPDVRQMGRAPIARSWTGEN